MRPSCHLVEIKTPPSVRGHVQPPRAVWHSSAIENGPRKSARLGPQTEAWGGTFLEKAQAPHSLHFRCQNCSEGSCAPATWTRFLSVWAERLGGPRLGGTLIQETLKRGVWVGVRGTEPCYSVSSPSKLLVLVWMSWPCALLRVWRIFLLQHTGEPCKSMGCMKI